MIASTCSFTLGLRAISQEDKILGPLREWIIKARRKTTVTTIVQGNTRMTTTITTALVPEWLHKPLLTCVTCMASIWGFVITITASTLFYHFNLLQDLRETITFLVSTIFICISASFINELMWSLKEKLQS